MLRSGKLETTKRSADCCDQGPGSARFPVRSLACLLDYTRACGALEAAFMVAGLLATPVSSKLGEDAQPFLSGSNVVWHNFALLSQGRWDGLSALALTERFSSGHCLAASTFLLESPLLLSGTSELGAPAHNSLNTAG